MLNNPLEQESIVWLERDDVYRPILKSFEEFLAERSIKSQHLEDHSVYIKAEAEGQLKSHLYSDLHSEQGGILFGNAYQDVSSLIYVEITAAVSALSTIASGTHLQFTPNSWLEIMNVARRSHESENIVGWYHSHPNLGAFMSKTDLKTQAAFFHHPWCLSIVFDPVRDEIGFFLGKNAISVQPLIY